MDYSIIYDSLMEKARLRGRPDAYFEKHHIRPRSMGGDNAPDNLVNLTAREHFLAHWMLWKIYRTPETARAWWRMACVAIGGKRYSSRNFARARRLFSDTHKGSHHHAARPVICLDDLRIFESAQIASLAVGARRSGVAEAIGRGQKCAGLRFAFVGEDPPAFKTHRGMPLKAVTCVSTGVDFESCHSAGAEMGVHEHSIRMAAKNGTRCVGLLWKWK